MKMTRKVVVYLTIAGLLALFLICGIYVFIPIVLEKTLFPRIARSIGFANSAVEVRKFSLSRLDMASLRWGESTNPFLLIDSLRVDYSLPGLLKRHIRKIIVSGIEIRAEYKDGSIVIPGGDFNSIFKISAETKPEDPDKPYQLELPVSFEEFEIRNATMILTSGNAVFRIPLTMQARPIPGDGSDDPSGYTIHMGLYLDFTDSRTALNIASRLDMDSTVNFQTDEISTKLSFSEMNINYDGYQIRNAPGDIPLTIEMRKIKDVLHVNFTRFCIASPFPVELSMDKNADCRLRFFQDGMDVQGVMQVNLLKELPETASDVGLRVEQAEPIPIRFGGRKQGNSWRFFLNSSRLKKSLKFRRQTETIGFYPDGISIRGKGTASQGDVRFTAKMSDVVYDSDNIHVSCPGMLMYGNSVIKNSRSFLTNAFMKLTNAEFKGGGIYAGKIDARIPFQWPYASQEDGFIESKKNAARYVTVDKVKYYDMDIGTIALTPYQDGMGVRFLGHYADVFPGFQLDFSGRAGMNDAGDFVTKIDFKTLYPGKVFSIDLGKFSPQLSGMFFEGNIDMDGSCQSTGSTIKSNALISTHHAKMEISSKKMTLEGIDLDLDLSDLYQFHSAPDQVLKFKRFAWGDIEVNEGEVSFQIESLSSFFLKTSGFSWCGGHVYTHGLHVKSGKKEIDTTCYCDRLKLAALLKQFNAASAEGEGAVNGRIPINYKDGKIKIIDGFLYSTPGEGGTISFRTDALIPGASGMQQSIQMQIAQEALKNFNYDWAKLSLMSKDEDLMIRMQMNGRPAGPLPFGFRKDTGLVKIDQPRAYFQGIHFNINFKLPLDKMLYYGSGFSGFMQNK
ncbi:MAG: hypothetical protein AYP45_06685 [Candidatus Brocadia carolinensis]|uniref:Uncharacterized protein n=1 Tax=Candidatus Brocadia carolinensis TaxID=1004156 RepID=A0A1V4AUW0_9BACT|nr:MAG: hypothetical protein AYP45_06685 [Candidatus Brocadia caroliniensis]